MAINVPHGSLFAVLLRSSWWYSALIALSIIVISLVLVGGNYGVLFTSLSLPFIGIAGYVAYKQSKQPSRKQVLEFAQKAYGMTATQIANKISETYVKERFDAEPFKGKAAEIALERGNRKLLLSSKRFKAANTGIEPLKQLVAAGENAEATGYLYVTLGEVSAPAQKYAEENNIELIGAHKLTAFFSEQVKID